MMDCGLHGGGDPGGQVLDLQRGIEHHVGTVVVPGPVQEGLPDAGMEIVGLGFEPVLGAVALCAAEPTGQRIDVEQDGQIGAETVGGPAVQPQHLLGPQSASDPLVGDRGINEAIANDRGPAGQGRKDDLLDMGGAGCGEHQGFGAGIDFAAAVVEHEGTQFLADGGASGFTGADDFTPTVLEPTDQQGGLGGFAGTIAAFEDDEQGSGRALHFIHPVSLSAPTR